MKYTSSYISTLSSIKACLLLLLIFISNISCSYSMPNVTKKQVASCLLHAGTGFLTTLVLFDELSNKKGMIALAALASAYSNFHIAYSAISQTNTPPKSSLGAYLVSAAHVGNIGFTSFIIGEELCTAHRGRPDVVTSAIFALSLYSAAKELTSKSSSPVLPEGVNVVDAVSKTILSNDLFGTKDH